MLQRFGLGMITSAVYYIITEEKFWGTNAYPLAVGLLMVVIPWLRSRLPLRDD